MVSGDLKKLFVENFRKAVKFDEPLASYTTFGVGGPADVFIIVKQKQDVIKIFEISRKGSIPTFILGGGSNILVGDKGIRGVVIKNELNSIERKSNSIFLGSGVVIKTLLDFCKEQELSGLEFMAGMYGTVGGAISGNAGAYGHSIGEFVGSLHIINDRGWEELGSSDLRFSYRRFNIPNENVDRGNFFIDLCKLNLMKGNTKEIKIRMKKIICERDAKMKDPLPSAGCFFKNIESKESSWGKLSVGKLLEDIGAKSIGNGRVGVHKLHANIIMNYGGATAAEILAFANELKKRVYEKCGVKLEFEVKLVGEF